MEDAVRQKLMEKKQNLEEQVKFNPHTQAFWVQLGNVSKQLGDKNRAIEAYRKALELNPEDQYTKNILDELEGKGAGLPIQKQQPLTRPHEPQIEPSKIWLKYGLPAGIVLILIIAGVTYKIVKGVQIADPHLIMETDKNMMNPHVSPDGKWVAFKLDPPEEKRSWLSVLYVASPDAKTVIQLLEEKKGFSISCSDAVWLPDSSGFIIQTKQRGEDSQYSIVKIDEKTTIPIPMEYPPERSFRPALSPDGARIAYVVRNENDEDETEVGAGRRMSIVIADMESGFSGKIADYERIKKIAWSPDGNAIAFCGSYYDGEAGEMVNRIMLVEPEGSDIFTIGEADYGCNPKFFGAQDTSLVYTRDGTLYSVALATLSEPERLLPQKYEGRISGGLDVSADLKALAFTVTVGMVGGFGGGHPVADVFILKEGETEPIRAKNFHGAKYGPSLSPDGKWMAYEMMSSDPRAPFRVWVGSTPLGR